MIKSWGYDDKEVKGANFSKDTDKVRPPFIQRHTCTMCRFWNDHFQCPFTHTRVASCSEIETGTHHHLCLKMATDLPLQLGQEACHGRDPAQGRQRPHPRQGTSPTPFLTTLHFPLLSQQSTSNSPERLHFPTRRTSLRSSELTILHVQNKITGCDGVGAERLHARDRGRRQRGYSGPQHAQDHQQPRPQHGRPRYATNPISSIEA